jgi:hypothetical protein
MKDLLNGEFFAGDERVSIARAVDNLPSAGDSRIQYRPHESPANSGIADRAVDAGGILMRFLMMFSALFTDLPKLFQAALKVVVAEERAFDDPDSSLLTPRLLRPAPPWRSSVPG